MELLANSLDYIPVDYLKAQVIDLPVSLLFDNPLLNFIPTYQPDGGLRLYYAHHRGLLIKIYLSGRMTLQGSLHKYWNYGKHNYNDYTHSGFNQTIESLFDTMGIAPRNLRINCLEIGVNFPPPAATDLTLNGIFMHKGCDVEHRMSNDKAKYHGIEHDREEIKGYDKALQYKLIDPSMRFEVKYKNWSRFRNRGIVTLQDFIEADKTPFKSDLIDCWNELLFCDLTAHFPLDGMPYSNPNFWREKRQQVKRKELTRAGFAYHVTRLREINATGRNLQPEIARLIAEKIAFCART